MHALYSSDYFSGKEYGDYVADRPVLQKNFRSRLRDIHRHLPDTRHLSLFEVGCAYGFFLDVARAEFARVRGMDLAESIVAYGRAHFGVDAISGDFLTIDTTSDPVDVVCLWDTIEHLRAPQEFTGKASQLLRPGGWLFLTTGDISSFNARWRREKWRLIHPPTHLHYFSTNSIRALLEDQGFDVMEISHVGFYRSLGNTFANLLRRSNPPPWLARLSAIRLSFYLNLHDIMFVAARKRV